MDFSTIGMGNLPKIAICIHTAAANNLLAQDVVKGREFVRHPINRHRK